MSDVLGIAGAAVLLFTVAVDGRLFMSYRPPTIFPVVGLITATGLACASLVLAILGEGPIDQVQSALLFVFAILTLTVRIRFARRAGTDKSRRQREC